MVVCERRGDAGKKKGAASARWAFSKGLNGDVFL